MIINFGCILFSLSLLTNMLEEVHQSILQKMVVERSTQFFAASQFLGFSREMNKERIKATTIRQVSLKCYGYGYFEEYKVKIKDNLLSYIEAIMAQCDELSVFKLIFNGFDINDDYLQRILQTIIKALPDKKNISTIWIHTNHLTSCSKKDFATMLKLIEEAGQQLQREEISVQITHWKFQKPLTLVQIIKLFQTFIRDSIELNVGLKYKKFRLEMSSWFLKTDQAYSFLRSGMDNKSIIDQLAINDTQARNKTINFLNNTTHQTYSEFTSGKNDIEKEVRKLINRSLNEQIIYHLVHNFQSQIVQLVSKLLSILFQVQDFTIDLRNWNGLFKMPELSNKLQSKSGPRNQFSIVYSKNPASKRINAQDLGQSPQSVLRTTYLL